MRMTKKQIAELVSSATSFAIVRSEESAVPPSTLPKPEVIIPSSNTVYTLAMCINEIHDQKIGYPTYRDWLMRLTLEVREEGDWVLVECKPFGKSFLVQDLVVRTKDKLVYTEGNCSGVFVKPLAGAVEYKLLSSNKYPNGCYSYKYEIWSRTGAWIAYSERALLEHATGCELYESSVLYYLKPIQSK